MTHEAGFEGISIDNSYDAATQDLLSPAGLLCLGVVILKKCGFTVISIRHRNVSRPEAQHQPDFAVEERWALSACFVLQVLQQHVPWMVWRFRC